LAFTVLFWSLQLYGKIPWAHLPREMGLEIPMPPRVGTFPDGSSRRFSAGKWYTPVPYGTGRAESEVIASTSLGSAEAGGREGRTRSSPGQGSSPPAPSRLVPGPSLSASSSSNGSRPRPSSPAERHSHRHKGTDAGAGTGMSCHVCGGGETAGRAAGRQIYYSTDLLQYRSTTVVL
jgi:hypothetical protein